MEMSALAAKNVANLILEDPPVTVYNIPAPLLVNDDGTVTPVEEILAKPENIEPELMHADANNKDPVSVRVHMPSSNLSNNVKTKIVKKPTSTRITDFKNDLKRVFTPLKQPTTLGQAGSVTIKTINKSDLMRYDADSKEEAQCPVCRKKFLNKVYMLAHYKKDHTKNGKKFACVKCNFKAPYNEQVMTAHLRMHELADASKKSYKSAVNNEKEIFYLVG